MTTSLDTGTAQWPGVLAELRSAVRDECAHRDAEAGRARQAHCDHLAHNAAQFWTGLTGGNLNAPALAWIGYTDPATTGKNSMAVAAIGSGVAACYRTPRGTRRPAVSLIVPCGCGAWTEEEVRSAHTLLKTLDQVADGARFDSCYHLDSLGRGARAADVDHDPAAGAGADW